MQNPKFIDIEDVIRIHSEVVKDTGESECIINYGYLESAVYQPQQGYEDVYFYPTIYDQAAVYLFHIACNHAFEQGNKRTAFAVMVTFLNKNDYDINISTEESVDLVLDVVTHKISKDYLPVVLRCFITTLI